MSKHTPGPWQWVNSRTDEPFNFDAEWDGEGRPSLRTKAERKKNEDSRWELPLPDWILDAEPMQHGNDAANARLIAAAPELLETLQSLLWYVGQLEELVYGADDAGDHEDVAKARAAIAKAKGEQHGTL